jgi:hypothetical protein
MRDRGFCVERRNHGSIRHGGSGAGLDGLALLAQESTDDLKKELEQLRKEVDSLKSVNSTKEIPAMGKIDMDAMAADESPIMTLFKGTKLSGHVDTAYGFSFNQLHANLTGVGAEHGQQPPSACSTTRTTASTSTRRR